jgi:hypothetical protein
MTFDDIEYDRYSDDGNPYFPKDREDDRSHEDDEAEVT